MTDAIQQRVVISGRDIQELDAALLQLGHGLDDVLGRDRDVLHAFAVVEIEVFLDLRFLFAFGRLVDRKLHEAVAVAHDLAHQRGVFGRDILVVEGQDVAEAHHILVKLHPRIHLVPADVADAMIDILQAGLRRVDTADSHFRKPGMKAPV